MPAPDKGLILVIDDDDIVRATSVAILRKGGYQAVDAANVAEGLRQFARLRPAGVLLDLRLPDGTGIDVLQALQREAPGTPVIVVSGVGTVSEAVEAMRVGATDFIEKPVEPDSLLRVLERVMRPTLFGPESDREIDGGRFGMVGRSDPMRRIYQLIEMAAPTRSRVLICGESGSGKELIARAIHALSPRRARPFVELNCAAIPSELIESEMFGHVRGAFTGATTDRKGRFEVAHTGTLFLDELGDMSLSAQAKLLRVLQEGVISPVGSSDTRVVDVRVLAATSKHIPEEIARGAFREDLYHRLNVLTINVPPLRTRRQDIPDLAAHFLRLASLENGMPPKRLAPRAADFLGHLPWKGNVRELRNLMERLVVMAPGETVGYREVMEALQMNPAPQGTALASPVPATLREARARFERQYILERLAANEGSLMRTARDLGIERTNLYRKMKQLGIRAGDLDS
jgi:two-component system nitrogen regulation response regulator NtrX